MKRRFSLLLLTLGLVLGYIAIGTAQAAAPPPAPARGLLITPLRQYLSVDAGHGTQSSFSVANLTSNPLSVSLSVEQFSVTDYTYDYTFHAPANNWLHIDQSVVILQPNQTRDISYSLDVPARSAPGGYYYTLLASANLASGGVSSTLQAADLAYVTVNGKLSTVSHLEDSSIQLISFGRTIPFRLRPINTGNVYSFVYIGGQLHGLFTKPAETSSAHVLLPGKVRSLSGSIPSPALPGIYRATYGYKTASNWVVQQSRWVVYIPPWSVAFVLAIAILASAARKRRGGKPAGDKDSQSDQG